MYIWALKTEALPIALIVHYVKDFGKILTLALAFPCLLLPLVDGVTIDTRLLVPNVAEWRLCIVRKPGLAWGRTCRDCVVSSSYREVTSVNWKVRYLKVRFVEVR